ncbi:PQQ-dependent sugar dehydrogenase [Lutimaribacter sp. EGI FJ00014]|nr:PQQ-dependent sugar dehydrogenase [Lutimaribacter sp. EGI FJ00014]
MLRTAFLALSLSLAAPLQADTLSSDSGPLRGELVADDFLGPWSLGFLPDGGVLVTEKEGALWILRADGNRDRVAGLPDDIVQVGQGGLLDVLIPRDFAQTREVIFSHAARQPGGAGTAISAGTLTADGTRLQDVRRLFEMAPGSSGGRHFGGRLVEGPDGYIFLSIGDRGDRPSAQDLGRHNGSIIRINRDGSVPSDNPLVGREGVQPEIWSWGHRNPQGMTLDAQGRLWTNAHGARGGDEVNLIAKGRNYGWPVISYGRHYSGAKIGEGTSKPGMEQPAFYWDPSIAPSGLVIYSGKLWPEWRGDFLVGSLKFDLVSRLSGTPLQEAERIEGDATSRVRDLREAPDGSIWMISEGNGAIYRLTPGD